MTLEEYRQEQDSLTAAVLALVVRLLRAVGTGSRPLRPDEFDAVVDALLPTVLSARSAAFELARTMYADLAEVPVAELPEVPEPHYERAALESALDRTARARLVVLDDPDEDTGLRDSAGVAGAAGEVARSARTVDTAATTAAAAVARHVEMAGRDGMVATSRADARALGWARVGTGRENCAFCTMLISRGPVYKSARQAGVDADDRAAIAAAGAESMLGLMTQWHDGCDCIAVPVFDEDSWPGRAQFLDAEELWRVSTRGASGIGMLRALRQALDERATA